MPEPFRLTFLITDLHRGGSPLMLASLAPGLKARGMDVEVVSIAPEGEVAAILESGGVRVISLEAGSVRDVGAVGRLVGCLKRRRPQMVFSILIHANLLSTLARPFVPGTLWVQSIHTLQARPRWHWYLQGILSSFADAVVAPSRAVLREMGHYGPLPRAAAIPNGIDVRRFYEAAAIPESDRPWPRGAFVVGYLGRFDRVKRLPLLLHSVRICRKEARFERLRVALVGYGAEEKSLKNLARKLGIESHVHFLPATREPERWYKAFDLFCSPSDAEGFGLTLAEATVAGVPVLACDTAAVRETLGENGAIWLAQDLTAQALAQQIERLMAGEIRYRAEPLNILERQFGVGAMVEGYAEFIERLMSLCR